MPIRQLTSGAYGHMLTHAGVWLPDSRWIVYDTRRTLDGSVFDGTRIERVAVDTQQVEVLANAPQQGCGVVTASPQDERIVFILGPFEPTPDWEYGAAHRQGVVVRTTRPDAFELLDARNLTPPFTPGALRGGSHLHAFNCAGTLVSFTYEDAVLADQLGGPRTAATEKNLRGIGVSICGRAVQVPKTHPRNHDGTAFSVLVTELTDAPAPGSDEISRACEEAWIGTHGYRRSTGAWQANAIAFQGLVSTATGEAISEVFVVDLPDNLALLQTGATAPIAGTLTRRPAVPCGASQRRITFTATRKHPGISGPRHWLRSSPDGSQIACLMRTDAGHVQIHAVSPNGGEPRQITHDPWSISSAFTWSPDGSQLACIADGSVLAIDVASGQSRRLTHPVSGRAGPRPEACVFSPDGKHVAFMQPVLSTADGLPEAGQFYNQIFIVDV